MTLPVDKKPVGGSIAGKKPLPQTPVNLRRARALRAKRMTILGKP